jgi:hypothetical protein
VRLKRRTFTAIFLPTCIAALELEKVVLNEIRGQRLSGREKLFWLSVGFVFVVGFLCFVPAHYEICEISERTHDKDCGSYQLAPFIALKILQTLDRMGGVLTALATIAIAWFTLSLRQSTDKLWDAGERQLKLLAETSASQSRDMQASIAATDASAKAAQKAADVSEAALIVAERPYLVPREPKLKMYRFGHPGMPPSEPPEWVGVLEYGFGNMGRSVAFLKEVTAELIFVKELPAKPQFSDDGVRCLVGHYPIGVEKPYSCPNYGIKDKINASTFALIRAYDLKGFFFGYVRYTDIFGYLHTEGFCFRFTRIGDGAGVESVCAIVAGDSYNYTRREKIPPEGIDSIAPQGTELSADDVARLNKKLKDATLGTGAAPG